MTDKVTTSINIKKNINPFKIVAALFICAGSVNASETDNQNLYDLFVLPSFIKTNMSRVNIQAIPKIMVNPKLDQIEITGLDASASMWSAASLVGLKVARSYFSKRSHKKNQAMLSTQIISECAPLDISAIHSWSPILDSSIATDDFAAVATKRQEFIEKLACDYNEKVDTHNNRVKNQNQFVKNQMKKAARARRFACVGRLAPFMAATGVYLAVASRDSGDESHINLVDETVA